MSNELKTLIEQAKGRQMTGAERDEQCISFAYGNVGLENDAVTRDSVRQVFAQMRTEDRHECRAEAGRR